MIRPDTSDENIFHGSPHKISNSSLLLENGSCYKLKNRCSEVVKFCSTVFVERHFPIFSLLWYTLSQTWLYEKALLKSEDAPFFSTLTSFMMKGHIPNRKHSWPTAQLLLFKSHSVTVRSRMETNSVTLHVKWQVIWPWKAPVTVGALKWLCTSVFSVMSCKFIRTCKAPRAAFPGTFVGFLPCVGPPVSFEMRAFGVNFRAAFVITFVDPSSFHMVSFAGEQKKKKKELLDTNMQVQSVF